MRLIVSECLKSSSRGNKRSRSNRQESRHEIAARSRLKCRSRSIGGLLRAVSRISAPFQVVAAILILAATVSAMIGHCYSDHRTLVACGLFLLSGKYVIELP
ncbi:hypothetical protein G5I_12611 [Acromyrmex echinatior]|uniref:Uncharacterized protein n=1 Tax=Acromyrmex echinatior TaxID=103372 RepID=F4X2T0_ACREC|nr:hypothetical protein G5I_12611 [Acromyrmex echinatior]